MGDQIIKEKVEAALGRIRAGLRSEGGDIELVDVRGTVVYVKLMGACGTCPMSTLTMKNLVEKNIRQELPEITSVQAV